MCKQFLCFLVLLMLMPGIMANAADLNYDNESVSISAELNQVYSSDQLNFSIYESRLLDTYFIACALYFDFDSSNLLPDADQHNLYSDARDYFITYRDHEFIHNLGSYVDSQYKAERGGVVLPLLMHSFSDLDYGFGIGNVQTDVFQNAEEFNLFLVHLKAFYNETNAGAFFDHAESQKAMIDYLKAEVPKSDLIELMLKMEAYTGNKTELYGESEIRYRSVVTLFRPFNASFYSFGTNDATYFIGQLSPTTDEKNPDVFSINQFIETTVHEFLHKYINQPVYELDETILELAKDKSKDDYAGNNQLYQMMDWHRLVDENIVRAVETSIYADIYNDRDKAYDEIMRKEVEFGGMQHLPKLYDSLEQYENNRETYTNISSYLYELIRVLFSA